MHQPHSIICSWCLFVSKRFTQFGFVLYARPCIMCSCFVLGLKHLAAFIDSFLPLGNTGRPDHKICFTACSFLQTHTQTTNATVAFSRSFRIGFICTSFYFKQALKSDSLIVNVLINSKRPIIQLVNSHSALFYFCFIGNQTN